MIRVALLAPVAAFLAALAVYLLTPQTPLDQEAPLPGYVDGHAHLPCIGAGGSGCYIAPDLMDSYQFDLSVRQFGIDVAQLRRRGDDLLARRMNRLLRDSAQVHKAVVLAMDGVIRDGELARSETRVYVPNEYVSRLAGEYRYLEYGASINPERPDWRQRLARAARSGALLVKWVPAAMKIDPANPAYGPFYAALAELGLPLLVSVGRGSLVDGDPDELGDPKRLAAALEAGVTVIAAHGGTDGDYAGQPSHERVLEMLPDHPNLYADIAGLGRLSRVGYLSAILNESGASDRLLYGSDWPLQFFPLVSPFYHWPDISLGRAKSIQAIDNPWDRDVQMKKALGVPEAVLHRSAALLLPRPG